MQEDGQLTGRSPQLTTVGLRCLHKERQSIKIIKSYDLVNDPASPAWVRVVDAAGAALQPVRFQGHCDIHDGMLANDVAEFD